MTGKSLKSIYYHIVFHTKHNEPYLLNTELRKQVYHFINNKCKSHDLYLHAIGGTENHIHLLLYIPPKIAVSKAVKFIKGSSSYFVNKELIGENCLYWQEGYGIFTVSENQIPFIKRYIEKQVEHHKENTIITEFEETTNDNQIR